MPDGGPLHGPLAAPGCDIKASQAQLITHILGKVILQPRDRMTSPANHHAWGAVGAHHVGVAQYAKYGVCYFLWRGLPESLNRELVLGEYDIAQGAEQVIANALD